MERWIYLPTEGCFVSSKEAKQRERQNRLEQRKREQIPYILEKISKIHEGVISKGDQPNDGVFSLKRTNIEVRAYSTREDIRILRWYTDPEKVDNKTWPTSFTIFPNQHISLYVNEKQLPQASHWPISKEMVPHTHYRWNSKINETPLAFSGDINDFTSEYINLIYKTIKRAESLVEDEVVIHSE